MSALHNESSCQRAPQKNGNLLFGILILASLGLSLFFRKRAFIDPALWYDEYYSATWATFDSFSYALDTIGKVDFHPPLYYSQLWLWARAGTSHSWLLLNSVALGLVSVLGCIFAGWRLQDRAAGILAGLLCAVSTQAVVQATELRMYVGLMALAPWAAYFAFAQALAEKPKWSTSIATLLLSLCIGYSHGTGFLWVVTMSFCQAAVLVRSPRKWPVIWACLATIVAASLGMLPWLLKAAGRSPGHLHEPDATLLWEITCQIISIHHMLPAVTSTLAVLWLIVVGTSFLRGQTVGPALALSILGTIGFGVLLSQYRPMIHLRAFLYLVPLGAVASGVCLAKLTSESKPLSRYLSAGAFVAFFFASFQASANHALRPPKVSITSRAIDVLKKKGAETMTVHARMPGDALAICWELIGPGSARSPEEPFQCRTDKGLLVVRHARFLDVPEGIEILELTKTKLRRPLPGFRVMDERKMRGYTIVRQKHVSSRRR